MSKANKPMNCVSKIEPLTVEAESDLKPKTDLELVSEIKGQWKLLWNECFNDKVKAEGVAMDNYSVLNVEKGTVIQASRDFKALNFKEILEQHKIENSERFIAPDNNTGGWNKFIKTKITNNKPLKEKSAALSCAASVKPKGQHHKKGGRGWLHNI